MRGRRREKTLMEKPTLTKEDRELYLVIVQKGNYDDMFDFAYSLGRQSALTEHLKFLEEHHV